MSLKTFHGSNFVHKQIFSVFSKQKMENLQIFKERKKAKMLSKIVKKWKQTGHIIYSSASSNCSKIR